MNFGELKAQILSAGIIDKPSTVRVVGDKHVATMMKVLTRDDHGRPSHLRVMHDDETVDVTQQGTEFFIVYARDSLMRKAD